MKTIGDIYAGLSDLLEAIMEDMDRDAIYSALEFLGALPDDLDTGSAAYYLNKEFKKNTTGIDARYDVEIYTAEPESYSGYDEDDDDEDWDSWYDSSLDEDDDEFY